jgi:Putative metallopeptidase
VVDTDPSDADWPGKLTTDYADASSPEAIRGRDFTQRKGVLEQFADDMNSTLRFPHDIPLQGKQCDESNLYWNPADKAVVLCYEGVAHLLDQFTGLGDANPDKAVFDTELLGFYHESGHMAIDIYNLPAVGREEDDADQVSAYLMLRPNADGTVDPASLDAITNAARSFAADADQSAVDDATLADVHSPTKARLYNLECWTYGADPSYGAKLVADGLLPQSRADGCQDEYAKLRSAWDRLLEPYVK